LPDGLAGNLPLIKERVVDALPGFLHGLDELDLTAWKDPKTGRLVCHWNDELVRLWRFLGNHRPLNHCIHVFVFGLKAKKAGSVVPPALLQVGCL
jgi:hypothetical protein